jgi:hypothetical protein
VDNEAGKIAVCWRNHVYIDTPTACSGEFHSGVCPLLDVGEAHAKLTDSIMFFAEGDVLVASTKFLLLNLSFEIPHRFGSSIWCCM